MLQFLPESPRYYISHHEYPKAKSIYSRIATLNGRGMFANQLEAEVNQDENSNAPAQSLLDICKPSNRSYLKPFIVVPLLWFTVDFVYYGIQFGLH